MPATSSATARPNALAHVSFGHVPGMHSNKHASVPSGRVAINWPSYFDASSRGVLNEKMRLCRWRRTSCSYLTRGVLRPIVSKREVDMGGR